MAQKMLQDILSPLTLARIDNYMLLAKVAVEGFIAGQHRSVYPGTGQEFQQYRNYTPGDDLRYVDWKVYAKQDRFYTRVYQEETNMNCFLVMDCSASMAYQGENAPCSKYRYSAILAACLGYLANRQGDKVGLCCYSDELLTHIAPGNRSGHLQRICAELERVTPGGTAHHDKYLSVVAEMLPKKSLVIFLSDFLDASGETADWLKRLTASGHDCLIVHVLDRDEIDFPFEGTARFRDSETNDEILTAPAEIRREYLSSMEAFVAEVHNTCADTRGEYLRVRTEETIGEILAMYLHSRGGVY